MSDLTSIAVSLSLASVTTLLLLLCATPLAYVFSRVSFPGKMLCEGVLNLPIVLPPTVLGFYLLLAMGPRGPVGALWENAFGSRLVFSFPGLVLASMVFSLPFAFMPLKTAFRKIDRRLIEAAYVLGCSPVSAFFRVALPNALTGVAGATALVFAHTMGEFGVALMIGGSIPGKTKVASIQIYEYVEMLQFDKAHMLCLILLPVSYATLIVLSWLDRR